MGDLTLGPPMIYIPIVRKPWDDPRTCIGGGAMGFVRVDVVDVCPIIVEEADDRKPAAN